MIDLPHIPQLSHVGQVRFSLTKCNILITPVSVYISLFNRILFTIMYFAVSIAIKGSVSEKVDIEKAFCKKKNIIHELVMWAGSFRRLDTQYL